MASSGEFPPTETSGSSEALITNVNESDATILMEVSTELTGTTKNFGTSTDVKGETEVTETSSDVQTTFIDTPKTDIDGNTVITASVVSSTTSVETDTLEDTSMKSSDTPKTDINGTTVITASVVSSTTSVETDTLEDTSMKSSDTPKTDIDGTTVITASVVSSTTSVETDTLEDTSMKSSDTPKTDIDGTTVITASVVSSTTSVETDTLKDTSMKPCETSTESITTTSYIEADLTSMSLSTATDIQIETMTVATESPVISTRVSTAELPHSSREQSETSAASDTTITYFITDIYTSSSSTEVAPAISGESSINSCGDCSSNIGLSIGVSTGVVVIIICGSLFAILRMKSKWRTKIAEKRSNADVWTTEIHNNTIVNENFIDYHLMTPKVTSNDISNHDQIDLNLPHMSFDFPNPTYSSNSSSLDEMEEFSTRQCHVVSRNGLLTVPQKLLAMRQKSDPSPSHTNVQGAKERPATFRSGNNEKHDRHVLLRHEEIVVDDFIASLGQLPQKSNANEISTEL